MEQSFRRPASPKTVQRQIVATSLRHPQPPGTYSPSCFIPEASQISMAMPLTALTSSAVAPLLRAPRKWPLSCGLTCRCQDDPKPSGI